MAPASSMQAVNVLLRVPVWQTSATRLEGVLGVRRQ
jgi:hypothetical protein